MVLWLLQSLYPLFLDFKEEDPMNSREGARHGVGGGNDVIILIRFKNKIVTNVTIDI